MCKKRDHDITASRLGRSYFHIFEQRGMAFQPRA